MANVSRVSGNAIITLVLDPVMEMMKDLIKKEDSRQILQTDLRPMETLLQYTGNIFRDQLTDPPEMVKIWLQLLQNSLTEANGLFHRSRPRLQSCLACVVCNPGRLSKEIREWNALFNHLYQAFSTDLFQDIALSGNAMISVTVEQLLKDDISEEDKRQILQMESLLLDFKTLFRLQKEALVEIVKTWLPLLVNSLIEAKGLLDSSAPRQSFLDYVSKEIREWRASFERYLFQHNVLSGNAIIRHVVDPVMELLKEVIEEDNRQILQTDLRRIETLLLDITTLFRDEPDITTLFQSQNKAFLEITTKTWLPLLQNSLTEAKRCLLIDRVVAEASFDKIFHGFQSDLSILVTSLQFLSSNPLHIEEKAKEPTVIQPLSRDEAWMLFRRVVFKDDKVSMDIEDRARKIAEQCRGVSLAIHVVAAAMIGQTSLHEWDICLSSIQNVDPFFPATASGLDAQLYAALRFSYDALPNSDVKKCFLYCALYNEEQEIDTLELLQMWIGEGVVKSKQGTYFMDMAVGRKYLKLLVDRCLFQRSYERTNVFKQNKIRVQSAIRAMAIYIGQKEENCLFMATQNQPNFPEVHDDNCRNISLVNLPTHLQCPKLASLTLRDNRTLKELPSEFVVSLTSLRVLNLSGCTQITSVPTSIEQLRMLEFLSLRDLPIKDLPKEVCRLSKLQSLDLSHCQRLKSLPSEIGEIKNLKCLNLDECRLLKMIPREISELTSLSRLVLPEDMGLSMETEAPASIWSLKGLKNMTELRVEMQLEQQLKDGIMGTWSEMRHLILRWARNLPEDMKSMKKLQSFMLQWYEGSSLPNCKFEHLEVVSLYRCTNIKELSPLEWMPNLKLLKLRGCHGLRELGIGSRGSGSPSGYQTLQKLVLKDLDNLESLGGASKRGVWDERTVPHLRVLKIQLCPSLKRFPVGMEKLLNLCAIKGTSYWWERIRWEDENMKIKMQKIMKQY